MTRGRAGHDPFVMTKEIFVFVEIYSEFRLTLVSCCRSPLTLLPRRKPDEGPVQVDNEAPADTN
jgi:hypothetical protein